MQRLPKPIVGSINGVAAGAGLNIALATDLRIAADTARVGEVFARVGLVPDGGGTYFLPRLVGMANAMEMVLLADIIVMSGGRVIFAAALGYREVEFRAFGTTQKERVPRFEENLEAVKRLWTEDSVDMVGSHFTLEHAAVGTKPVQKPHPPIWIGANADPAIRRAARLGDCVRRG